MEYSLQQRAERIIAACMEQRGTDPYEIFCTIAREDYVSIHGPEHHVLDGACILTAFRNAGGNLDLHAALQKLLREGLRMPGAACGLWGVCGAVTSIGAALAIIEGTGPLSAEDWGSHMEYTSAALAIIDGTGPLSTEDWGSHMEYTSAALARLAKTGGPRCCKRDAFMAMEQAVSYIKERYGVTLDMPQIQCAFSARNAQCIGLRCPYHVLDQE